MRTIEWHLETGMNGADWSGQLTVGENVTDEEIEELVREEVFNIVQWGWSEIARTPQTPG